MESKNLNLILNKKITKAWRGGGFFISFNFGKTITRNGVNKVEEIIEISYPEISLNIDSAWAFVKNGKDVVGTDSEKNEADLMDEIDQFLDNNFRPDTVEITDIEKQEEVTIIFFSNGLELEMNNGGENDEDWYLLIDDSVKI